MKKEELFLYQNELFRNPMEIVGAFLPDIKTLTKSLAFEYDNNFSEILSKLNISLIISREYEHLLISLSPDNGKIKQNFYPIAHPSGLAVNEGKLYVASTRNPNRIVEFSPVENFMNRLDDRKKSTPLKTLLPSRLKYYPGAYYFHDLAFVNNQLYGNSVGMNGVIPVNLNKSETEQPIWQPKLSAKDSELLFKKNYLQINSIAAGKTIEESYFSASAQKPIALQPGDVNFPVDKKGVIFSGNGEVYATGLTRPHSARIYQNTVWVNNSGYGDFGLIDNHQFKSVVGLNSWTRGLLFHDHYAFIGVSRVLPKFSQYAPGVDENKSICGIVIFDMNKMTIAGSAKFKNGNQIFSIEALAADQFDGFLEFKHFLNPSTLKSIFYKFINRK